MNSAVLERQAPAAAPAAARAPAAEPELSLAEWLAPVSEPRPDEGRRLTAFVAATALGFCALGAALVKTLGSQADADAQTWGAAGVLLLLVGAAAAAPRTDLDRASRPANR